MRQVTWMLPQQSQQKNIYLKKDFSPVTGQLYEERAGEWHKRFLEKISQSKKNAAVAAEREATTAREAAAEKEKQEAEANAMSDQNPRIYLKDYLIKVPVGTSVDLLSYVSEIKDDSDDVYTLWRKVQITGEVNSAVPGTYKCTYYVIDSQNNISNNAVLTVIVE